MVERLDVVIIGAGQAGLAMSWQLRERGMEHVVLERGRVGQRWRTERWDSLAFQFPNWSLSLPGLAYDGPGRTGSHTTLRSSLGSSGTLRSSRPRFASR